MNFPFSKKFPVVFSDQYSKTMRLHKEHLDWKFQHHLWEYQLLWEKNAKMALKKIITLRYFYFHFKVSVLYSYIDTSQCNNAIIYTTIFKINVTLPKALLIIQMSSHHVKMFQIFSDNFHQVMIHPKNHIISINNKSHVIYHTMCINLVVS